MISAKTANGLLYYKQVVIPLDVSNPGVQPTAQPDGSPQPQCPSGDWVSHKVPALPCAADTVSRPRSKRPRNPLALASEQPWPLQRGASLGGAHRPGRRAEGAPFPGTGSSDSGKCAAALRTRLDIGIRFPLLPSGGQTWEQQPGVREAPSTIN